jgi:hypothetical protein
MPTTVALTGSGMGAGEPVYTPRVVLAGEIRGPRIGMAEIGAGFLIGGKTGSNGYRSGRSGSCSR